jgi:hypothetical protein
MTALAGFSYDRLKKLSRRTPRYVFPLSKTCWALLGGPKTFCATKKDCGKPGCPNDHRSKAHRLRRSEWQEAADAAAMREEILRRVQTSEKVALAVAYGSDPRRPAAPMSGLTSPPFSLAVCVRTSLSPSAVTARPMITPNKSSTIIVSPVRAGVRYRSDPKRITTAPMRIAASPMQQASLSRQAICWRGGGDPAFNCGPADRPDTTARPVCSG